MKESNRLVVSGLVVLLLILWLGFLVHRSPRFAGSEGGHLLGIVGASLMLVPLLYMIVKRVPPLRKVVTRRVSMRALLSWHIYAGVIGPILVLLHTGHKFVSPLGAWLTALTIIVVLSGFTGRYLLSRFSQEIGEKREILTHLELAYHQTATELATHPEQAAVLRPFSGFLTRLGAGFSVALGRAEAGSMPASMRAIQLSESMADVEYAIKTHETFKRAFGGWLKLHIAISVVLYGLLALHVWAAIHFGLRWS